jgi:SurA-like N-terminal domain
MKRTDAARGLSREVRPAGPLRMLAPIVLRPAASGCVAHGVLAILLLAMLGLWFPARVAASQEKPVAKVYQEVITAEMLAPSEAGLSPLRRRLGDELAGLWAREARRKALRRQIVHKLLEVYCTEQGIGASEAEVQGYLDYLRWRTQEFRERLTREWEELTASKLRPELPENERVRILRRLEHLRRKISLLDDKLAAGNEETSGVARPTGEQHALARDEVLRWKGYKALYERYGGDVMCDAKGLVPVGAIQALVEERQSTFGVVLLDPDYQQVLEDFSPSLVGTHFPVTRQQAEAYFSRPWWVTAVDEPASDDGAGPQPAAGGD